MGRQRRGRFPLCLEIPRVISHDCRLRDVEDDLAAFLEVAESYIDQAA